MIKVKLDVIKDSFNTYINDKELDVYVETDFIGIKFPDYDRVITVRRADMKKIVNL